MRRCSKTCSCRQHEKESYGKAVTKHGQLQLLTKFSLCSIRRAFRSLRNPRWLSFNPLIAREDLRAAKIRRRTRYEAVMFLHPKVGTPKHEKRQKQHSPIFLQEIFHFNQRYVHIGWNTQALQLFAPTLAAHFEHSARCFRFFGVSIPLCKHNHDTMHPSTKLECVRQTFRT